MAETIFQKIRGFIIRRHWTVTDYFLWLSATVIALNTVILIAQGGNGLSSLLWNAGQQSVFTDFFESVRDSVRENPYDYGIIYPPLSYAFLSSLAAIIPEDSSHWPTVQPSVGGITVAILFFFVFTFLILLIACKQLNLSGRQSFFLSVLFLFSPGYVFMIGQGNIIILALFFLMVFCFFYRSESPRKRELALISLAVSANFKIYPAVFGVLLLRDGKLREAFRCALYGLAMFILPFFSMGGIGNLLKLYENVRSQSRYVVLNRRNSGYGYMINLTNLLDAICDHFNSSANAYLNPSLQLICALSIILLFWFSRKEWKRIYALTMALTILPSFSGMYNAIYLFPSLALFLRNRENASKKNFYYALLFFLMFVSFPFGYLFKELDGANKISVSTLLVVCSQVAMLFSLTVEMVASLIRDLSAYSYAIKSDTPNYDWSLQNEKDYFFGALIPRLRLIAANLSKRFQNMGSSLFPRPAILQTDAAPEDTSMQVRGAWTWMWILSAMITAYYCIFARSVIPPQMGWWQYMGWRIVEGDFPYRDFYLFLPPYYVLALAALYRIFGNHFFSYTVLGFFLTRLGTCCILYRILLRKLRPAYAACAVFTGMCLTSSYLMDLTLDYNPVVYALTAVTALCLMKCYESKSSAYQLIYLGATGVGSGILLMTKQTVGIAVPLVCFVLILLGSIRKPRQKTGKYLSVYLLCLILAALPGILYITGNHLTEDFLRCISTSSQSKLANSSLFLIALHNFFSLKEFLLIALLIAWRSFIGTIASSTKRRNINLLLLCGMIFFVGFFCRDGIKFAFSFLITWYDAFLLASLWMAILAGCCVVNYKAVQKTGKRSKLSAVVYSLTLIAIVAAFILCPKRVLDIASYGLLFRSVKRMLLYILWYLDLAIWIRSVYHIAVWRERVQVSWFFPFTVGMALVCVQFLSAPLEELHGFILLSIFLTYFFNISFESHRLNYCKNAILLMGCTLLCALCLFQKIVIPYEWHSWRVPTLYDEENPMRAVSVDGLEGFRIPQSDANAYEKIVNLIQKYSNADDTVYQFPNIALFNVLTNRKTVYDAIPYFDVTPDALAVRSAEELEETPPEMVIWSQLSEARWKVHEDYYRNGKLSGQREIAKWHDKYVTSHYRRVDVFDNNENDGGFIALYAKAAFAGGIALERIFIDPERRILEQYARFSESQFQKYVLMIPEDVNFPYGQEAIFTLYNSEGNVINSARGFLDPEDREYRALTLDSPVSVNKEETYKIEIEFIEVPYAFQIGVTESGTASAEKYCVYQGERQDFNLSLFCE